MSLAVAGLKFVSKRSVQCLSKSLKGLSHGRPVCLVQNPLKFCGLRTTHTGSSYFVPLKLESETDKVFDDIVDCVMSDLNDRKLQEVAEWLKQVIYYIVPYGKRTRQRAIRQAYKAIAPKEQQTPENLNLVEILGWCMEFCQGFFLIEDDIVDQSTLRRGKLCWYKNEGVGLNAVNDGLLLENLVFLVLKKYFSKHPAYVDLVETFHQTIWLTVAGQAQDLLLTPGFSKPDLAKLTNDLHYSIASHKTAYYTFWQPVTLAAHFAGLKDFYDKSVQDIYMKIGLFYQVQDDILDCYGDPKIMGKEATDIKDGKCTWLIINAMKRATPEQFAVLKANYGARKDECVQRVKEIYNVMGLYQLFLEYEKQEYAFITSEIEKLSPSCKIPKKVVQHMLDELFKREV